MNINNNTYDKLCVMRLTQTKKIWEIIIVVCSCYSKGLLYGIHCITISICDSVSQFNDGAN